MNINIEVPQRSILGLIIFILYINDINNYLDISDDRMLILFTDKAFVENNNIDLINQLLSDVDSLYDWFILNIQSTILY